MSNRRWSRAVTSAVALGVSLVASNAAAGPREECIESHGRAQDLRERGQLVRARQTFLTCAQSSCPSLVQQDCAKYSEELAQLVPTLTFGARDATAGDLPATTVYVDDVLVTTRLDDGRSYEVDPGKHVIRYSHDGRETLLKVIVNQGEKSRLLVATFVDRAAPRRTAPETEPPAAESGRSGLPFVVVGLGAAAAATGGVLFGLGASQVPDGCSMSTKECTAPPNDPALSEAASGVRLANTGIAVGIAGVVTMAVGLVWYFAQPSSSSSSRRGRITGPMLTF